MSDSLGPRPFDFMPGYPNRKPQQYMNLGMLKSPYPGKTGVGDYGPTQGGGIFYRPHNPTYPYPMDFNSNGEGPMLAYDQDIPKFLRREDQALLKAGAFGPRAQRQAIDMASGFTPRGGYSGCGCGN
jgi:hypothetical protein